MDFESLYGILMLMFIPCYVVLALLLLYNYYHIYYMYDNILAHANITNSNTSIVNVSLRLQLLYRDCYPYTALHNDSCRLHANQTPFCTHTTNPAAFVTTSTSDV